MNLRSQHYTWIQDPSYQNQIKKWVHPHFLSKDNWDKRETLNRFHLKNLNVAPVISPSQWYFFQDGSLFKLFNHSDHDTRLWAIHTAPYTVIRYNQSRLIKIYYSELCQLTYDSDFHIASAVYFSLLKFILSTNMRLIIEQEIITSSLYSNTIRGISPTIVFRLMKLNTVCRFIQLSKFERQVLQYWDQIKTTLNQPSKWVIYNYESKIGFIKFLYPFDVTKLDENDAENISGKTSENPRIVPAFNKSKYPLFTQFYK